MYRLAISSLFLLQVRSKDFTPYSHNYALERPATVVAEHHFDLSASHGILGFASNGIPFMSQHYEPDANGRVVAQPLSLEFDNCGGHGDGYGHYHYHLAPLCLMRYSSSAVPQVASWWASNSNDTWKYWPANGVPVHVGTALDGFPIYGPYNPFSGALLRSPASDPKSPLDECHGMRSKAGEYMYFLTSTPPFLPPCLRHRPGVVRGFENKGLQCESSGLLFSGCPNHPWYQGVSKELPADIKERLVPEFQAASEVPGRKGRINAGGDHEEPDQLSQDFCSHRKCQRYTDWRNIYTGSSNLHDPVQVKRAKQMDSAADVQVLYLNL